VSHVTSIRQVSIVLSVLLGSLVLDEPSGRIRLTASFVMLTGIAAISLAD